VSLSLIELDAPSCFFCPSARKSVAPLNGRLSFSPGVVWGCFGRQLRLPGGGGGGLGVCVIRVGGIGCGGWGGGLGGPGFRWASGRGAPGAFEGGGGTGRGLRGRGGVEGLADGYLWVARWLRGFWLGGGL